MTAAVALYARLNLAPPWLPEPCGLCTPLVIYGASSSVGSYAVQLARRSNIHPLICIAGNSKDHVEQFIDRAQGDTVLDYRNGDAALVEGMRAALLGKPLEFAFDAVSDETSSKNICEVLHPTGGKIAFVLPEHLSTAKVPSGIQPTYSNVVDVHKNLHDFGLVYTRLLAKGLEDGWFVPQPHEVVPGGLNGVEEGLRRLRDGKARAVKYVFRIAETPGLGT
jgi:NADPH:quinone reductase